MENKEKKPIVLCIMDGWGINKKTENNAIALAKTPNVDFLDGLVELDEKGYIITSPDTSKTSIEGVFASGDIQDQRYMQAITAAGSGCMAAIDAEHYLESLK